MAVKILLSLGIVVSTVSASATLTPNFERGEKNVYHNSPRGIQEVCVIPAKYPGAKYKKKDLKKETELCNYSFYQPSADEQAAGIKPAALCAKTNSTNPAVNIFKVPDGQSIASVEASACRGASKIGKYKNSTSCSYTPSILAYYHISRILGNIGRVPVSVLRSMDLVRHKELAQKGLAGTKSTDLIHQTWSGLLSVLNAGLASSRKDLLLSDDGKQSYGAFIVNPKNESFYRALFNAGSDRAVAFRDNNPLFRLVRDGRSLDQVVSPQWSKDNLQKLYAMKDITEFILLDHLLDQQDRFGNIAAQTKIAYMAKDDASDANYEMHFADDQQDYDKDKTAGLVDVTRAPISVDVMVLKDNDCGVTKTNVVKQAQLLKYVRHMEPKTYKKLLEFQASVQQNKRFFISNLMFTERDFNELVANINDAVSILQGNCRSGALKLDLDVDHYIETRSLNTGSCELN